MSKLSTYVLTFNEEGKIRGALESLTWADEIVVLDSHSTDRTEQICREYTEKSISATLRASANSAIGRWSWSPTTGC